LLACGLTHAPPHRTVPVWQAQAPFEHVAPAGHCIPPTHPVFAPQNRLLVNGLTHAPLQTTPPIGHMQVPLLHTEPSPGQFCPAEVPVQGPLAPQKRWLLLGSMQPPLHSTNIALHEDVHPREQTCAQVVPQAPHDVESVCVSTHVGVEPTVHVV
jgi:hypothetical protein